MQGKTQFQDWEPVVLKKSDTKEKEKLNKEKEFI